MDPDAVRAGISNDPNRRAGSYGRDNYRGEMFYAPTEDMRGSENRMFEDRKYKYNDQGKSNAQSVPGYKYVIKGEKSFLEPILGPIFDWMF